MNGCRVHNGSNVLLEPLTAIVTPLQHKPMSAPPGPRGPPLIGQAFNLDTSHMHIQFMEWQKRHGDLFMFKVLGKHYLVISHPDILRKMFVTCEHAQRFNDRPSSFMGSHVIEQTKDIVFRSFDDKQKFLKRAALEYIEKTVRMEKWFYGNICDEMDTVVKQINSCQGHPVKILDILDSSAIRVIGLLLSGRSVHDDDDEFKCLLRFMETGNELGTVKNQTILTTIPAMRKIPGKLKDIYDTICEEKRKLRQYFITEKRGDRGLVSALEKLGETIKETKGEDWLNDDFIMGVIMDLTAAAIVPLQNTMSVLFLVLAHHPKVQAKIRKEIDALTSHPTVEDVAKMPYTAACMLELKRFHTPLPISARHSNRSGDAKFEKYTIPKNTEIFSNLFGIHHDERFFEDPWTFKPERFINSEGQLVSDEDPVMKNMIATGVGPRSCVGSKFTENIMFLTATSILQKYAILPVESEPLPECDPRKFLPGVVIRSPDFACWFRDVHT